MEQINAEGDSSGNSRAMIKLIFTLRDRNDKWFVHLVAATKKCGYLLDDINPRLKEAGHIFFILLVKYCNLFFSVLCFVACFYLPCLCGHQLN